MVEVHATHGYLIEEFLSSRTNKRTDCYGGPLENRIRFLLEIVAEVRSRVGPDFPVSVRMGGFDAEDSRMPLPKYDEVIEVAKSLEKAGVNVLNVSFGGRYLESSQIKSETFTPLATNTWAAAIIKKNVSLPVITCGSITNPSLAEEILETGQADFIGMGRPLFADPYFSKKAKQGRPQDIRPCIRCGDGCVSRSNWQSKAILCTVNVALGREEEFKITRIERPKKVAIVGGGAAGMEAARVCGLFGHDVTLFERRKLGGMLHEASVPGFKADIRPLLSYFVTQMDELKIKVVTREATTDTLQNGGFESVIMATGATPLTPQVPGVNNPLVCGALEVLNGGKELGRKVIIIGGGMVGTEVGLFLAQKGHEIVFVEMLDELMNGILPQEKADYKIRLEQYPVSIYTGTRLIKVQDDGVIVDNRFGQQHEILGNNVVIAAGFRPNRDLIESLQNQTNLEVYEAGDCIQPRRIFEAIHEGDWVARQLTNN
jgi:NADPH-dependent 2,4-dienoyl-CoA reductase/sulfur reductase-like enzyme